MNSLAILLTDDKSISENIILKSYKYLENTKIKKIYFIGCKERFIKIFYKFSKKRKYEFINITLKKNKYKQYLKKITLKSIQLHKSKKIKFIINMPLDKKKCLNKNFNGFTEFFSYCIDKTKNENMLLYSEKSFSVCPLTTHIQIKNIDKKINKTLLINAIKNIIKFYKKINKKIQIIVLGLNPHASKDMMIKNKDKTVITNVIKRMKKKVNIIGPIPADTAFNNIKNSNKVFLGMYHDQVLIPFKLVNKFDGINITIGKKIIRMSPDHGVAKNLINTKKSFNNNSFKRCLDFCEKKINA